MSSIVDISLSADNELLATISDDMSLKVYDITNFGKYNLSSTSKHAINPLFFCYIDMINMIKLKFKPKAVCWIHQKGQAQALVTV